MTDEVDAAMEDGKQKLFKKLMIELCAGAPSAAIRDCLRKYKCGNKYTYNDQYNSIQGFTKGVIVDTLSYLGCKNEWTDFVKKQCVHELICRLQNLCPELCTLCNALYCTPKDQISLLSCDICYQEAHRECLFTKLELNVSEKYTKSDILSLLNPLNMQGFHYICHSCDKQVIPNPNAGKKKKT